MKAIGLAWPPAPEVSAPPEPTESMRKSREKVSCDQEVWVMGRIRTAILMAEALNSECRVGADRPLMDYAIRGLIEGTAVELIQTLGYDPSFENIRPVNERGCKEQNNKAQVKALAAAAFQAERYLTEKGCSHEYPVMKKLRAALQSFKAQELESTDEELESTDDEAM